MIPSRSSPAINTTSNRELSRDKQLGYRRASNFDGLSSGYAGSGKQSHSGPAVSPNSHQKSFQVSPASIKTPGEFSLQTVFSEFVKAADSKLRTVLTASVNNVPSATMIANGFNSQSSFGGSTLGGSLSNPSAGSYGDMRGNLGGSDFPSSMSISVNSAGLMIQPGNNSIISSSLASISPSPTPNTDQYLSDLAFADMASAASSTAPPTGIHGFADPQSLSIYLGEGADVYFDRLIVCLASITKYRARSVIDALMIWRKMKSDPVDKSEIQSIIGDKVPESKLNEYQTALKERKMLAANYILCRVLIEIMKHLKPEHLSAELADKLEEMVFSQLRAADPEIMASNSNRMLNLDVFSELLGNISRLRFLSISSRFMHELKNIGSMKESKVDLIMHSMRFLKMKVYPQEQLDLTLQFFSILAQNFHNSHSTSIKHAYSRIISELLLPLGAVVTAEPNIPQWIANVELIYSKALKMSSKLRHQPFAIPLMTTMLTVSKKDMFLAKFGPLLDMIFQRFKDKSMKTLMMTCFTRILWSYLYRCSESMNATQKRLEVSMRILFPGGKKQLYPTDVPLFNFIQIIYIVAWRYPEFATKHLLFSLMNIDSTGNLNPEQLAPERILVAFKTFIALLQSNDHQKPEFPNRYEVLPSQYPIINTPLDNVSSNPLKDDSKPFDIYDSNGPRKLNKRYEGYMGKVSAYMFRVVKAFDQIIGSYLLTDEKMLTGSSKSSTFSAVSTGTGGALSGLTGLESSLSGLMSKEKQCFYEVTKAWILAIPGLITSEIDQVELVDLLIKYTTHAEPELARSAYEALIRMVNMPVKNPDTTTLKAIESRRHLVAKSFAKFLLTLSDKIPDVIQRSLKIYIDIWTTWLRDGEENQDIGSTSSLSESMVSPVISDDSLLIRDRLRDVELISSVFLCSRLPAIRRLAFDALEIRGRVEAKLKSEIQDYSTASPALEKVIYSIPVNIISNYRSDYSSISETPLSVEKTDPHFWKSLASSDKSSDILMWSKVFGDIISSFYEKCGDLVKKSLEVVLQRFLVIHPAVVSASDPSKLQSGTLTSKWSNKTSPATDDMIDQWKYYLVFACAAISESDPNWKKNKKSKTTKVTCAQELFMLVLPLLTSDKSSIRLSVVTSLGNVNPKVFKSLIDEFQAPLKTIIEDMKARYMRGTVRKAKRLDRLRAEITNIFHLSIKSVVKGNLLNESDYLEFISTFSREMCMFLSDNEVKLEWDHQMLRFYFCSFIERFYDAISFDSNPERIISFDLRHSLFILFEEWCGFGERGKLLRERESKMIASILEQIKDPREKESWMKAISEQRKALEYASLKAMASLCRGPHKPPSSSKLAISFSLNALLTWIDTILENQDSRITVIGSNALENLLRSNALDDSVWETMIVTAYQGSSGSKIAKAYFKAISKIFCESNYSGSKIKLLTVALLKISDQDSEVRNSSIRLLQEIEKRFQFLTAVDKHQIAILSTSSVSYKRAMKDISLEISQAHPEITHEVISEAFYRMELISYPRGRRDVLHLVLPWLLGIEITLDDRYGKVANLCWLLLWNMVFVTVKYSAESETEVEAIWAALASKNDNISYIVEFMVQHALERRSNQFPAIARKILLYVARTESSETLIDCLLNLLTPKSMVPIKCSRKDRFAKIDPEVYYVAGLDDLFKGESRKTVLSKGLLATLYLVDLCAELPEDLEFCFPVLVHAAITQIDYYSALARESARYLLGHLINFKCLSRGELDNGDKQLLTRLSNPGTLFEPSLSQHEKIPYREELEDIVSKTLDIFKKDNPDFLQAWGEVSVRWATTCPVRHIACRSLQVYRTLNPVFTQRLLADLLARMSNTISDIQVDVQGFSIEILVSLKSSIKTLNGKKLIFYPQLFWATVAALQTTIENEYQAALEIMHIFIKNVDLNDPSVLNVFMANQPISEVPFEGIQPLIIRGFGSSKCESLATDCLMELISVESDKLVDKSGIRNLFFVLPFIPTLLEGIAESNFEAKVARIAENLRDSIQSRAGMTPFVRFLEAYLRKKFRSPEDALKQVISIIKDTFFRGKEEKILRTLFEMLKNQKEYYRFRTLKILKPLLSHVERKNLSSEKAISPKLLQPLFKLFKSSFYFDAIEVLDEVIRIFDLKNSDSSVRVLLGSKAISRMSKDASKSIVFIDDGWPYDSSQTSKTRDGLSSIISTYISSNNPNNILKESNSSEQIFISDANTNNASRDQLGQEIQEYVDYDELVTKLQDLDEFFTEDMGINEMESTSSQSDDRLSDEGMKSGADYNIESNSEIYMDIAGDSRNPYLEQFGAEAGSEEFSSVQNLDDYDSSSSSTGSDASRQSTESFSLEEMLSKSYQ